MTVFATNDVMAVSFFSFKDGVEIAEDARVAVNRDRAPHGSYELVIHKVNYFTKNQWRHSFNNKLFRNFTSQWHYLAMQSNTKYDDWCLDKNNHF